MYALANDPGRLAEVNEAAAAGNIGSQGGYSSVLHTLLAHLTSTHAPHRVTADEGLLGPDKVSNMAVGGEPHGRPRRVVHHRGHSAVSTWSRKER